MALVAHLEINGVSIGWVAAVRETPGADGGLPADDERHDYKIESMVNGASRQGTVRQHRYGDGAVELMAQAMRAVAVREGDADG